MIFDRGNSFLYECMVEASGNYNQVGLPYLFHLVLLGFRSPHFVSKASEPTSCRCSI
jgi:hypothetical protein